MSLLNRWLSNGRVRAAIKRLAQEQNAIHYRELAHEFGVVGDLAKVLEVTAEGLKSFPQDAELQRLSERARAMQVEGRLRELQQELRIAPRPALRRELCELLLETGRVARAEDVATEWFQTGQGGEAMYYRGRARADRFFADKRREDGQLAWDLLTNSMDLLPHDARPLRVLVSIAMRVGAHGEARRHLAKLLEITPGDPLLESRFRMVAALAQQPQGLDKALREVERNGAFVHDENAEAQASAGRNARVVLQEVVEQDGVEAAFYVRGSTALVQGKKGATAERTARGVREVISSCKSTARRLGLGTAVDVRITGNFGTLMVAPGEQGSSAVWVRGLPSRQHEECLTALASASPQSVESGE